MYFWFDCAYRNLSEPVFENGEIKNTSIEEDSIMHAWTSAERKKLPCTQSKCQHNEVNNKFRKRKTLLICHCISPVSRCDTETSVQLRCSPVPELRTPCGRYIPMCLYLLRWQKV